MKHPLGGGLAAAALRSLAVSLDWIHAALASRRESGLERTPPPVSRVGPHVELDGARLLNLCSNDYLGFASDPGTRDLLVAAAATQPAGATASRLVSGDLPAHRDAEAALARFAGRDDAVLFATGYAANTGVLPALVGPGDVVLSDALNHASLIDGIRLSRATPLIYRHADAQHAADLARAHIRRAPVRRVVIATDALFSMDGDAAPVADLAVLARDLDAALVLDEAHSFGVHGPNGTGLAAAAGVRPDVLIGTLGKAAGLAGAFAACDAHVARWLRATARSFVYSTATLPVLAHVIPAQLTRLRTADDRRARLATYAHQLREVIASVSSSTSGAGLPSAIVPWIVGSAAAALQTSTALRARGVFVQAIRPPTVPAGTSRLRLVPTAAHSQEDIATASAAIRAVAAEAR